MNNNNNFFERSKDIESLDRKITERMTRPTIVDKMKAASKRKLLPLGWEKDLQEYWYVYAIMAVSAMFTLTLGIYMGLAPTLVTNPDGSQSILFNTDLGHVLLAIVYVIAFVSVTEGMFLICKWKYHTREENNPTQSNTMLAGMVISGLSILLTGWAGGTVVAHNIAFLSEFQEIPPVAQKWVVVAIPLLLALYAFLLSAYALSSESAQAERLTREQQRRMELDHKTRMQGIEAIGAEELQLAEINRYIQLVQAGKMNAADAQAAIRAGRTLKQEEIHRGRDIDGDGNIGSVSPAMRPTPTPVSANGDRKENFQ